MQKGAGKGVDERALGGENQMCGEGGGASVWCGAEGKKPGFPLEPADGGSRGGQGLGKPMGGMSGEEGREQLLLPPGHRLREGN